LNWLSGLRLLFLVILGLLFLGCLLGIVVKGPIVLAPARQKIDADVSASRLRAAVDALCSRFAPRDYLHTENLNRAAEWIAEQFRLAGLSVEIQEYEHAEGRYRNVIGLRRGSNADAPARVLGAHYDAYGEFPGANDNASGVAVLLELVRTLPDRPGKEDQYYVAFSTEEPPFFGTDEMGSAVFARELLRRNVKIDLMVALDLVGYFSDEPGSQHFPLPGLGLIYPKRGNFIAVVGDLGSSSQIQFVKQRLLASRALPVTAFRAPSAIPGVHWSDHISFRKLGLAGVLVTDTAFMRYPHYHTAEDTPDKLDYFRMSRLTLALHGLFAEPAQPGTN
jgi:hypothetical protein